MVDGPQMSFSIMDGNEKLASASPIIDDEEFLPGTSRLFESTSQHDNSTAPTHSAIFLSPQPTNSPNDPLNWSLPRKYWHTFLLCFITGLTAATANDAGSTQVGMNEELGISFASMSTASGVLFVGIGYWTLLISPIVWLFGRRLPYLICIAFGIIGATWMARVQNIQDSIWNQLFVGASEAAAEANVQLSLSEIWYDHQRGTVLGLYVLSTSIGTFLGPTIASFVTDSLGWRWVGLLSVIILSMTFLVLYFGLEETLFDRTAYEERTKPITNASEAGIPIISNCHSMPLPAEAPKTYWQRIAPITRAHNVRGTGFKQYFTRLFHTLRVFAFPAVIYSGLQWGAQDAWLSFYLTLQEDAWLGPPWNYSTSQSALMNIPTIIGAIIGCFWGGYMSDRFMVWRAKLRNGITEAEDRLWMMLPCAIISPVGLLIFGFSTANYWPWPIPYLGLGFIGFGWGCAGDLAMSYLMDAYPEMVLEGMVGVSVINNSLATLFSIFTDIWIDTAGIQNCFIAISCLDLAFILLTVPIIWYGKRCRRWTRNRYLEFVKIRHLI